MMYTFQNGYFYREDGRRYFPLGIFGGYFPGEWVGEEPGAKSQHGENLLELNRVPRSVWRSFFQKLRREGYSAIRLFPRGDCGGAAWEGLDLGGRVNRALWETLLAYMQTAEEYGLYTQLCLFTEPECSVYCQPLARRYWGVRTACENGLVPATSSQRRFWENPDDIVPLEGYYTDPDVLDCNRAFLRELLPLLKDSPVFGVELVNELGWVGPHGSPPSTFGWEQTEDYLSWAREMCRTIREAAPGLPICVSNPGVGILGHDPARWGADIQPDFFSLHSYNTLCGHLPGLDYAAVSDLALRYTQLGCPAMYGEWQVLEAEALGISPWEERLLARDMLWLSMLSGAPGCISWCGQAYGEYIALNEVFHRLDGESLERRRPDLRVDIGSVQGFFSGLVKNGASVCRLDGESWCPDRLAADGLHRYCVKRESPEYRRLLWLERCSLESGVDFELNGEGQGTPLSAVTREHFAALPKLLQPIPGYQIKALRNADGSAAVLYLRNYRNRPVYRRDGCGGELFALRVQETVPLTLYLCGGGPSSLEILDLDTCEWVGAAPAGDSVGLGVTSHDYVLILRFQTDAV